MRVHELPWELIKHESHALFGKKEVRELMRHYSTKKIGSVNSDREYAVSSHNHSCDGKVQKIEDMTKEAAIKGITMLVISDHNSDKAFNEQMGNKVVVPYHYKNKIVYAIRGMECNCMLDGRIKDMMFIGYRDKIKSRMPLEESINEAHKQGALIGITSPLNEPFFGPNEEQIEQLLESKKIDYMEVLNSSKGFPFFHADVLASIILREYNHFAPKNKKVAGIYVSDAHVKNNIMDAFFTVKKSDFKFLEEENPEKVAANPERIIESLRIAFRNNAVTNYGGYKSLSKLMFDTDTLESLMNQTLRTWEDYLHLRFSKHRERKHH